MLMVQRQEHLRGQCTEWSPVSFIVLVRDKQLVFTRDRALPQADTERLILRMATDDAPVQIPLQDSTLKMRRR